MKYIYLCIFLFTAILPTVCLADNNQNGFFIDGGIGRSSISEYPFNDNDTAYDVNVGYRWGWLGLEVGYVDPGKFQAPSLTLSGQGVTTIYNQSARIHGITAGANAHYDFTPNWYIGGRAGAFQWNSNNDFSFSASTPLGALPGFSAAYRYSNTNWYAGAALGYDFSKTFGIGVNYDYYRATTSHPDPQFNFTSGVWSVNADYRF